MELLENEQVKQIDGFPGYWITSMGRVWSDKSNKWLKPWENRHSEVQGENTVRLYVGLGRNNKRLVHRLVAEAFIPNPDNLPEVDHINTIASDNRAENLRWVSRQENMKNNITVERLKKNTGAFFELEEITTGKLYKGYQDAANAKGCCKATIMNHTEGHNRPGYKIYYRHTGQKFNNLYLTNDK